MDGARPALQTSILRTKLFVPPLRSQLVARLRLTQKLASAGPGGVILLSAPPGFGKTTLLSTWLAESEALSAWVSLDEGDNDPARFVAYLCAAVNGASAGSGDEALALLQSRQPPSLETILTVLLNELAMTERMVLVLDDYHVIRTPLIHSLLNFLLEHMPAGMRVVIAAREDPPFALSRWRARGRLTELRAADLRFTADEAAAFLNQVMGLDLQAKDIVALEERTEGWIAGLQLAALSLRGRAHREEFIAAFAGSHRYVLDYLIEEVLERQSLEVQNFLLQTCLLERMNAALCNALLQRDDSQRVLAKLERDNLFVIALDEERQWYRYHHLFVDVLRHRLNIEQAAQAPELHRRASEWFERNGSATEAIHHALAAKDVERAALLIEQNAETSLKRGEHTTVLGWLKDLPPQVMRRRPRLLIFRANAQNMGHELDAASQSLDAAESALDTSALVQSLYGEILALRVTLALNAGELERAIELAPRALANLPGESLRLRAETYSRLGIAYLQTDQLAPASETLDEAIRLSQAVGDLHITVVALHNQADIAAMQGHLRRAAQIDQHALDLVAAHAVVLPIVGFVYADLAEWYYERNDLDAAARYVNLIIGEGAQVGLPRVLPLGFVWQAHLLQTRGDGVGAHASLEVARQLIEKYHLPLYFAGKVNACQVRLWLDEAEPNLAAAGAWAQASGLTVDDKLEYLHEIEHLAFAHILIAQGEFGKALHLLARLVQAAESASRMQGVIKILAVQAVAHQAQSEFHRALSTLERALWLAEPEGFVRTFVDEGKAMRLLISDFQLMIEKRARDSKDETARRLLIYANKILALFPRTGVSQTQSEIKNASPRRKVEWDLKSEVLVEPLSDRESEILRLIAVGRTNPEIASTLILAVGTVKKHTNNIFTKLGVTNRTQAVARAREMGLLEN